MGAAATPLLIALTAGQTASTYIGQRKAANATQAQADYEARLGEMNAGLADREAADVLARGKEAELRRQGLTRSTVGSQRAALAAQGLDVNDGSAAQIQDEARLFGDEDVRVIRNNAAREAFGFKAQAMMSRAGAQFTRASGHDAARAMRSNANMTLLTGALSMAETWRNRPRGQSLKLPKGGPTPYPGLP